MHIPDNVFQKAVYDHWQQRDTQKRKGKPDQGNRSEATAGKQMDGFIHTITDLLVQAGVLENNIFVKKGLTVIPGFFRPTKEYDFLIVVDGWLKVVIELKSLAKGKDEKGIGKNFNNRVEEAMGSALDIWTAYREGAFGNNPAPWVGYLLLLEDCPKSNIPVKVSEPHFEVFEEFKPSSYSKRYELFCRKMVRERHYNAACFLTADKNKASDLPNYTEPASDLSAENFLRQVVRQAVS